MLTIAIIGAGKAGRFLAAKALQAGFRVVLEDVLPARLRAAELDLGACEPRGEIKVANSVEDAVRHADIAIDFVPDELESKLEILSMMDRMAPPRTVFCINTTALDVDDLASCSYRSDRCIGVSLRPESLDIDLRPAAGTSRETVQLVYQFFQQLGFETQQVLHHYSIEGRASLATENDSHN